VPDDTIVNLIEQLVDECDRQKQRTIMEQLCQLLAEERAQRKAVTTESS
jgi:hypothetical protein